MEWQATALVIFAATILWWAGFVAATAARLRDRELQILQTTAGVIGLVFFATIGGALCIAYRDDTADVLIVNNSAHRIIVDAGFSGDYATDHEIIDSHERMNLHEYSDPPAVAIFDFVEIRPASGLAEAIRIEGAMGDQGTTITVGDEP